MRFSTFALLFCIVLLSILNISTAQDYGIGAFQDDENINLPAFPQSPSAQSTGQQKQEAGDVSVTVKADGKPAIGVQVKLSCYGSGDDIRITDSFGAAVFHYVPVGQCQVIVTSGSNSDTKVIDVVKEQIKTVEFNFQTSNQVTGQAVAENKQDDSGRPSLWSFFSAIFSFVILVFFVYLGYKFVLKITRKVKQTQAAPESISIAATQQVSQPAVLAQPEVVEEKKEKLSERTKDILKILDDKEKQVVKFLLENDHSCSQAKIFYGTGIKRTTLHRIVDSLAAKKILQVEKRAKARYVSLTDWFLGQETEATENIPKS